jgi:hypothetical protein
MTRRVPEEMRHLKHLKDRQVYRGETHGAKFMALGETMSEETKIE